MQAATLTDATILYDQLAVLSPYLVTGINGDTFDNVRWLSPQAHHTSGSKQCIICLTSGTGRGYLTERDCRWDYVSASVDDRPDGEDAIVRCLRFLEVHTSERWGVVAKVALRHHRLLSCKHHLQRCAFAVQPRISHFPGWQWYCDIELELKFPSQVCNPDWPNTWPTCSSETLSLFIVR